ncbi:zinc finger protein 705A-like isoform X1 [Choloepus didactylus]|uniref:zinc finger protein 705A-like isoform X1 n=1 Tax=Choloepus didactylus TaxID=27675 RepID=UPI0018A09996|nr:zinc finger protein 705A-like isoform X1 [Choloepus didactylus]
MKPVESVTFSDVAINFTKEEWVMLDTNQRQMFRDVMLENINHLIFVGYQVYTSEVLSQSEQGELWRKGLRFLQVQSPGRENDRKKEEMIIMQHISKKDTSTNQTKIAKFQEDLCTAQFSKAEKERVGVIHGGGKEEEKKKTVTANTSYYCLLLHWRGKAGFLVRIQSCFRCRQG